MFFIITFIADFGSPSREPITESNKNDVILLFSEGLLQAFISLET